MHLTFELSSPSADTSKTELPHSHILRHVRPGELPERIGGSTYEGLCFQTLFFLGLILSAVVAIPVDPYGLSSPGLTYAAPKLLAAPAISYAAPKLLAAPAISYAAPAISYAPKVLAAPVAVAKVAVAEPYDPNPQYSFSYGVTDQHTGDSKQQEETLVNGVVHGSYSLAEPDGTIRKVTYTADKVNGFNAVVEKKGVAAVAIAKPALAVAAVPAITKLGYAAAPALSLGGYH
ncbi:larval cuticle protein A3A [Drosophila biarmipes]|uniref:larval cuticle protein A3A n=1 Tax=Drosophila biarmipes TaxID=125945 RepID=UPI0021CCA2F9|nr:larval cuticle protein A3A [Drosophila biarmipes]